MRTELSGFIRDAMQANVRQYNGQVRLDHVNYDRVADEVLERMDELTEGCSTEAPSNLLIDERAKDMGRLLVWEKANG